MFQLKKGFRFFQLIFLVFLLLLFGFSPVNAQMHHLAQNQVAILGWADDTHYLLRTYDQDKNLVIQSVNIKNGIGKIVPAEESARDLLYQSLPEGIKASMVVDISDEMNCIAILKENDLFYFSMEDNQLKRLTNDNDVEVNARFSPDSKKIAYTKLNDLYVFDLVKNKEIRLTFDASEKVYNGYSSWVYMEEILGRASRYAAFWWSPDSKRIAYLRTDDSEVPVFTLNRLDEADGIHGLIEATPYPKAGDPNPKVKMGIVDISTVKTVWVKTDYSIDQYIAWPFWTPDSKRLAVQVVNRDQNELKIILTDPLSGCFSQIYHETRSTWVEFREDIYVMKNGSGFIIRSYKNDWENLYYYGWDGRLMAQLTDFDFRVTKIDRVDEDIKVVYFTATGSESTDIHSFRVGLDGKNIIQFTKGTGTHNVSISPKGDYIIDTWSNISTPGSIIAYNRKGKFLKEIHKYEKPVSDPSLSSVSELVKIKTSDGLFDMPAIITYPIDFNPSKKYPVIFTIYGGPDSKNVQNRWGGSGPSWYSQNNIITIRVDHRGSGQFGKKGLDYMYRSLGKWEISDYEDAVRYLRNLAFVDHSRMGITGSSYGGYVSCLALTKGADYWTHGFAISSVTDFRLYDNIYTERFMDTPQDNPDGYKDGSALTYAGDYRGKLYITHGDMDDNVHMQNSIHLISRLQDEGKSFEFMLYPGERHGTRGKKASHSRNEAHNFWLRNFFEK